ncbi:hypothetical protein [Microbacterium oxydans]|nr:hypothetical protein [Microbacterium oxydans]MCZ4301561.1 hypothetical protein [Microbacterium oxydans]
MAVLFANGGVIVVIARILGRTVHVLGASDAKAEPVLPWSDRRPRIRR